MNPMRLDFILHGATIEDGGRHSLVRKVSMPRSDSPFKARRLWLGLGYVSLAVLLGMIGMAWQQERALSTWQMEARTALETSATAARQRLEAARAVVGTYSVALAEAGLGLRPPDDPVVSDELRQRWTASGARAAWLLDFTGEPILAMPQTASLSDGVATPLALRAGLRGQSGSALAGEAGAPALRLYVPLHAGETGRSQVAALLLFDFPWTGLIDSGSDATFPLLLTPEGRVVAGSPPTLLGQRLPAAEARLNLPGIGSFARVDVQLEIGDADGAWGLVRIQPLVGWLSFTPWLHWGGAAAALLLLALVFAHLVEVQRRAQERRRVTPMLQTTPPTRLPYIEGLDLDAGLNAVEGDETRYLDRLRVFMLEEGTRLRLIHVHLVEGRLEAAEVAVTQAHDAAREVGASVLQLRLDMLHASVRRRDPASQIEPRLRDAATELDKTLRAIWAGLDKVDYLPPGMSEPPAPIGEAGIALPVTDAGEATTTLDFDAAFDPGAVPARVAPSPLESLLQRIERQDRDTLAYLKANQVALARTLTPRAVVELNRRLAAGDWSGAAALCRDAL